MRIEEISTGLTRGDDGVFFASSAGRVSYAADGHADCFQVEDASFWFRHRNDCIAAVVANNPFAGTLLDIGGGNGYVAQRLVAEGHQVLLLEPGIVGARNAKHARNLPLVACATVEAAGFRPASFGAVGLFDVIEHIDADRAFIATVASLLPQGGALYLTVPCHDWLWSNADVQAGHYRRHTRASIDAMLAGLFEIDYFSYYFQPLVLPQYLFRALPHRLGVGRNRPLLSASTEHGTGHGLAARALERMLSRESLRISRGESIPFGASAIIAAHRI